MSTPHGGCAEKTPRRDGYLRLTPARRQVARESEPPGNRGALLFVDVEGDSVEVEDVISSLQEVPQRLTYTKYVLVRTPHITAGLSEAHETALAEEDRAWAKTLAERSLAAGFRSVHLGVVRFRVGQMPLVSWAPGTGAHEVSDAELLQRALRVELLTLLEFGNAIWRPEQYHYQLPSGQHAASFIRVGDAFRSPRDVHAIASWLTPRLRDRQAVVADSASLVPLITEIHALVRRQGWVPEHVEMLDEYPRTRLDISRVVRPLRKSAGGVLGLMSVNSSGRYHGMFNDTLAGTFGEGLWSMVVMVDKNETRGDRKYLPPYNGASHPVATWLGFSDRRTRSVAEAGCPWCKDNQKAQIVRIDPRTFEALALPDVNLLMPSVNSAKSTTGFWDLCAAGDALGARARSKPNPSSISRPKSGLMSVLVDVEALVACDDFVPAIEKRVAELRKENGPKALRYPDVQGVLVNTYEEGLPYFKEKFKELRKTFGLENAELIPVDLDEDDAPARVAELGNVLVFALGSVSGWNLRQLLTRVQESWRPVADKTLAGLVLHARPQTIREWETLQNSYSGDLTALWQSYLPWRDPLAEEASALKELSPEALASLSDDAAEFRELRIDITTPRIEQWKARVKDYNDAIAEGQPALDPRAVLWGLPPHGGSHKLRLRSLYGYEVNALTAYSAIGSAVHYQRQRDADFDPRRRVFDIPSITRSYYDAIIIASILRWTEPQEVWWGHSEAEAANVMGELLARTVEVKERKLLVPELLYAASQGKVPAEAQEVLCAMAATIVKDWPKEHLAPYELAEALLANATNRTPDDTD